MPEPDIAREDPSFGKRIQELRRERRFTQRGLADRVGIDFTYLSKLENGRGEPPSEATVRRLATELEANPEELLALAGKISVELRERAAEDPAFALLLRRLPGLSRERLDRIYREADIRLPEDKPGSSSP